MSNSPTADREQPPKGYLSDEHKRKFTITAGILGAVFFMAQFIAPFFIMFAIMPGMMFSMESWMKESLPNRGAFWNDKIWYIEKTIPTNPSAGGKTTIKTVSFESESIPEDVAELPMENAWLMNDGDKLWIISSSFVAYYQEQGIEILLEEKHLGDISRPFLYNGYPAVVEESPSGHSLLIFKEHSWRKMHTLHLQPKDDPCSMHHNLQVLSNGNRLYLFFRFGETLYFREGLPLDGQDDPDSWEPVCDVGYRWFTASIDGMPTVFYRQTGDTSTISSMRWEGSRWTPFFAYNNLMAENIGVFQIQPGVFTIAFQTFPGSLRVVLFEDTQVVREIKHGKGFPFPSGFMLIAFVPHVLSMFMPLILAIILSGLMRKHRLCEHENDSIMMPFASLTRRALAQIIDSIVLFGPLLAFGIFAMSSLVDMEEIFLAGPAGMVTLLGVMLGALVWICVWFFLFSFLEGKWGGTPGKWAVGIRVLGTDLIPCGFGRALVRNLLKIVDGFFNFMVGILIVALSENWQRLGDMAARTVVVDIKAG